jgi:transposase InsO family protein
MRTDGLVVKRPKRFVATMDSKHDYAIAPNLLEREFSAQSPNRVWAADITYLPTLEGWLYLAVILDLFSRRVVGWATAEHMRAELALKALDMAITQRRPGRELVHHSDRGSQYACDAYRNALAEIGAKRSMSRRGDCWDNAPVESFFGSLKRELLDGEVFASRMQGRKAVWEYVERYYNRRRRHSVLDYQSPAAYEMKAA